MKKTIAFLTASAFWAVCSNAHSDYSVTDKGTWPKSWPSELEPLRRRVLDARQRAHFLFQSRPRTLSDLSSSANPARHRQRHSLGAPARFAAGCASPRSHR